MDLRALAPPDLQLSDADFDPTSTRDVHTCIDRKTGLIAVRWDRFDTHLKTSKDKYIKVNGQTVYASMNHFARAALMRSMKNTLLPVIMALRTMLHKESYVLSNRCNWLITVVGVPGGYGDVQMRMTNSGPQLVGGDKPTEDWDIGNQWIWGKAFLDACQDKDVLKNDSVGYVAYEGTLWEPVPLLEDRHLTFCFFPWKLQSSL